MDTNKRKTIKRIASISQNKARKIKYQCLFPGCKLDSIKSHSLQKSFTLNRIAQKGKVIGLEIDTTTFETYLKNEASFRLIGIKEASTFDGFCSYHDHQIFYEIENDNFIPNSLHHNLLLYLRSLSCLYSHKRNTAELFKITADEYLKIYDFSEVKYFRKQYKIYKSVANKMLRNINIIFHDIKRGKITNFGFCSIVDDNEYALSCSTLIDFPLFLGIKKRFSIWNQFGFSFIPDTNKTYTSFVWRKGCDFIMMRLIRHYENNLNDLLNQILFHYTEDTFFNPEKWNELNEETKRYLRRSFTHPKFRLPQESKDILSYFKVE